MLVASSQSARLISKGYHLRQLRKIRDAIRLERPWSGLAATVSTRSGFEHGPQGPLEGRQTTGQGHGKQDDRNSNQTQTLKDEEITPYLRNHPYRKFITTWKSKEELAQHLMDNIVHNKAGIVAFNKPYGVGVSNVQELKQYERDLAERTGKTDWHAPPKLQDPPPPAINSLYHARGVTLSTYTLLDVLPILRSKLGLPSLTFCKSTEKFSSGVAVFAENEQILEKLTASAKRAKGSKVKHSSYIFVSTLIPELQNDQLHETVGISSQPQEFQGRKLYVPIIERKFSTKRMKAHEVHPVQADVKILSCNTRLNSALVEVQTTLTKQHFLRVYANDLLMPILGDHLYSNRIQSMLGVPVAVNPLSVEPGTSTQVVSNHLLRTLTMAKAEDFIIVPLHVHQYRYTAAHYFGKWNHLNITAPPPNYFQWTCSQLKLDLENALNNASWPSDYLS